MSNYDTIVLNSALRDSGTYSDFIVQADFKIAKGEYVVSAVCLTNSSYHFDATNNVIYFNEGAGDLSAQIAPGVYTGISLATQVSSVLTAASGNATTYTASYSSSTYKLTIAGTAAFSLRFATTANSAASRLGFSALNSASATSQVATNIVDLVSPTFVCVHIDGVPDSVTSLKQREISCAAIIPLSVGMGGTLYHEWKIPAILRLDGTYFRVRLTDMFNVPFILYSDWVLVVKRC